MHNSVISAKGQTTVPLGIRHQLGVKSGALLVWQVLNDGQLLVQVKDKDVQELRGMFEAPVGKHAPVEQMNPSWR